MDRAVKQRFLAVARAAGLLPLLEPVRFMRCKWKSAAENRLFLARNPDFAPPPLWWMHDMYRHTLFSVYWRTGKASAAVIADKIDAHVEAETPRVADWGCGLGRVIRHLPLHFERTGFDYNPRAINWCGRHIAGARFLKNDLSPPLPVADASFDALYALSVFTHLSAESHGRWIAEIERVLAPGGIFLGAFHMQPRVGQLLPKEKAQFGAGGLVIRGGVKEGSRTFTAYHPESYLRETLLKNFDILETPFDLLGQTIFTARRSQ